MSVAGLRDENASWLRVRYVGRLLSLRPASVLDVGTGFGHVLSALRAAGVQARALEPDTERVAALRAQELDVEVGRAEALPLEDGAVDWVSLRHVLHHLPDPAAALREAARVARSGLVVAEPWRDAALPGQEAGARLDRWLKRQDRRLGRTHDDDLAPAALAALLAEAGAFELELETHLALRPLPFAEYEGDVAERLAGLGDDHPERAALEPILALARATGVGPVGTAIVVARRRA